ncbi:MAG: Smr/MutS family protein [Methylocystaceae bacterium]
MEKLDLHGLNVEEALAKASSQIEWLLDKGIDVLVINHGKGHHSEHGIGVVRQKIRAMLKEKGTLLKENGYLVVYGESDYPVALEYDAGCTLIVQRGIEQQYLGGRQKAAKNKAVYSPEGRDERKQQKRNRHR